MAIHPADPTAARVAVRFLGHATVLLDIGGTRVLTDPFLRGRLGPLERHGPIPDATAIGDVDAILITHGHRDHLDRASLRALPGDPILIVPRGLAASVRHARPWASRIVELVAGETARLGDLTIEAVPARHWIAPGDPRATPVGYLVEGSPSVYVAGDTGRFPALGDLAGRVDLALLPVWTWGPHLGPGHLGPRSAAEVLRDLGARAAVPIHWGTLYPRRLHHVWSRPLEEPGPRFAAHAARVAPGADVRVLRPGEMTTIEL